jgi:hypothetical protein
LFWGFGNLGEQMTEIVKEFWAVIIGAVAFLVWLVRLEATGLRNKSEIARLWAQRKEDLQNAKEARDETNQMLSEIRTDIKLLLTRGVEK